MSLRVASRGSPTFAPLLASAQLNYPITKFPNYKFPSDLHHCTYSRHLRYTLPTMPPPQKTVGIVLFPDVEVLDFCGPYEVFNVTRLQEERRFDEPSPFRVVLVGQKKELITTVGGMRVLPDVEFDSCPRLNILLVPGGWGTRLEMSNPRLLEFVQAQAKNVELLCSVCTGALVLGAAGLLDGKHATTHYGAFDLFRQRVPGAHLIEDLHVVSDGNLMTSAGISAGIDLALLVVARYFGSPVARNAARRMEYPYPESNARRVNLRPEASVLEL